jgi:hypothetical protein
VLSKKCEEISITLMSFAWDLRISKVTLILFRWDLRRTDVTEWIIFSLQLPNMQ